MSYSRTVHCSSCGRAGHNRAGCSVLKSRIEKLRAADPDDYRVMSYDTKAERRKRNRSKDNQKCSYCREYGHTRASCAEFKSKKVQLAEEINLFKQAWVILINHYGLGHGAIVQAHLNASSRDDFDEASSVAFMVTDHNWKECDFSMLRRLRSDQGNSPAFFKGIVLRQGENVANYHRQALPLNGSGTLNLLPESLVDHEDSSDVFDMYGYDLNKTRVIGPGQPVKPPKKWYTSHSNLLKGLLHKASHWHHESIYVFDEDGKNFLKGILSAHAEGSLEGFLSPKQIS